MPILWIVHRDPRRRAAIARLAAAPEDTVLGAPGDPLFDAAPTPEVVLLGPAGDFEAELQFAHRAAPRAGRAAWILLPERGHLEEVARLFDTLDADVLAFPPDPDVLRSRILAAPERAHPLPLSQRPAREALSGRFGRWFADLELPQLMRALDPGLADVPVLIRGERGTGRGLLAHYLHAFGGTSDGVLIHVACTPRASAEEIREALRAGARTKRARSACAVWLEDADRLAAPVQRQLLRWIELAAPEGALPSYRVRWIATAADEPGGPLDPDLQQALSGIAIRIPPLRDRTPLVATFANETTRAWCAARGERPRRFGEDAIAVLEEYPWPGNLREFEAVVVQTLRAGSADPVRAADLEYDGRAFAPLNALEVGALIAEAEEGGAPAAGHPPPAPPLLDAEAMAAELAPELLDPEAMEAALLEEPPGAERFEPTPAAEPSVGDAALKRLLAAIDHELRNPLSTIRTFAELLPERYQDAEFRGRFSELVLQAVQRITGVVERLSQLASLREPSREAVDVAGLLEQLLDERRELIHRRRLLVLKELDASQPYARGDAEQLRLAFEALLHKCLDLVPERGDVYLASKHHPSGLRGEPSVRVLVRFHGPAAEGAGPRVPGLSPADHAVEFAVAETIVRSQGGVFAIDASEGNETVIVLDLPAPG